jgi:Holliday junction resolvasome RuvABC endonuclease subunit
VRSTFSRFPRPYPKSKVALSKNSQQLREKQRLEGQGHAESYQVKQHNNPCVGQVLRLVGDTRLLHDADTVAISFASLKKGMLPVSLIRENDL